MSFVRLNNQDGKERLRGYGVSLVKTELKTFVADIQHDNGATVVRKTAICQAPDRATAASRIAREVEKTSEDTIYFLSIREIGDLVIVASN